MQKVWDFAGPFMRWILLALILLAVLALLVPLVGLQPPREFTIATGREGGAYYTFAQRYQELFAEEGYTRLKCRRRCSMNSMICAGTPTLS